MWSWSGRASLGFRRPSELAKEGFRVTLIDRHPYNTFQPLLYQVATGGLNPGDVTYSLRYFAARHRGVRFRRAAVVGIDHDAQEVICDDGVRVAFDYLVDRQRDHHQPLRHPGRGRVHDVDVHPRRGAEGARHHLRQPGDHRGPSDPNTGGFTVVVVGGGATGVEMAGQLAELKTETIPSTYPELNPARVHVVLVEMAEHLLAPFDDSLRKYALRELIKRGVDVRLKTAISEVHADRVDFKDGSSMPVDLVIWAAGVSGSPKIRELGAADRPSVAGSRSTATPRVVGFENIFAIGDASVIVDNPLPQLAQPALQTGKHAGQQIARLHRGLETETFRYHDKGTMATIGRGDAVLQMPIGLKLTGVHRLARLDRAAHRLPARRPQPGPDPDQPRAPVTPARAAPTPSSAT